MQGNQSYMKAFKDLGSSEVIHEETLSALEKFVCQVYGDKKCESVNELRHKKLVSKGNNRKKKPPATSSASSDDQASPEKQKNLVDLYKKMKRTNPVSFPPCYATFEQQVFRTNLVANMWKQAPNATMNMWDKTKHGYKILNGKCVVHWFDGEEVPDMTYTEPEEHEEEDPTDECDSSDESDSGSDNNENSDSDMDK